MKRALLCGASAAVTVAAGLWSTQAMAQTTPPPQQQAQNDQGIPTVQVVAQKRTEAIEKVPVAVTAFTNQQRQLIGIRTIDDMANFTPGLSYFNGDDRAFIRGIGRQTDLLSVNPGVAVYKDGVYAGGNGSIALQQDTLFVDRIEVERGPQSTLFGRNSDGGAINYIFRRPTSTWQEEVRVGGGTYGKVYAEGLISGPVNDNVRILFGGNYFDQTGGYWHNLDGHPQGGDVSQGGNGISHYFEAQVDANYGKFDWWAKVSSGGYLASWYQGPTLGPVDDTEFPAGIAGLEPSAFYGLCVLPGNTGLGCGSPLSPDTIIPGSVVHKGVTAIVNPANSNPRNFIGDEPNTTGVDGDFQISTTLTWHGPGVDVKYIGGYEKFLYTGLFSDQSGSNSGVISYQVAGATPLAAALSGCDFFFPATAAACQQPLTINPTPGFVTFIENEQFFSHELAFSSTYEGPLQFLGGLYWYHDHYDQPIDVNNYPFQTQLQHPLTVAFTQAPANPASATAITDRNASSDSYAVYGQADWKATEQFKITVGARYTWDRTSGVLSDRFIAFDNPILGLFGFPTASTFGANTPAIDVTPLFDAGPCATIAATHPKGVGQCRTNTTTGLDSTNFGGNFGALTGTAGIEWTPDSHTLAYFKYSRGYKAGGFNTPIINANVETPPEYVDDYEIGVKLSHPTWQINGDVFYYNYTNDQQPLSVESPLPGGGFQTVGSLFPIPVVHTWGVELEAIWRPIDNLVFSAQYSYLDARIASMGGQCVLDTSDPNALSPGANINCSAAQEAAIEAGDPNNRVQNVVGQFLPKAPKNKWSLNGIYTFHFDPGNLAISASLLWRDVSYGTIFNRPYDRQPSYYLLNLRATWTDAQNRYTVTGFVNNVFNKLWADDSTGALLSSAAPEALLGGNSEVIDKNITLGSPITAGIEVQVRFH
ncbi:MAG TPA: TonB-dependent receptor [Caulobacteraceae bacterium]|nr:TonB-dependent receptor [Caulobacteraceae bacterium]